MRIATWDQRRKRKRKGKEGGGGERWGQVELGTTQTKEEQYISSNRKWNRVDLRRDGICGSRAALSNQFCRTNDLFFASIGKPLINYPNLLGTLSLPFRWDTVVYFSKFIHSNLSKVPSFSDYNWLADEFATYSVCSEIFTSESLIAPRTFLWSLETPR